MSSRLVRRFRSSALLIVPGALAFAAQLCLAATPAQRPTPSQVDRDFGKLPLSFERNQGQTDPRVQFLSRGQGYSLFLTPGEAVLKLQKPVAHTNGSSKSQPLPAPSVLRMTLLGADTTAAVAGEQPLPGVANYFIGNDSSQWHSAVSTYRRVSYKAVYPGIDLVFYGNQRQLEYDFVVAPGADAASIALGFTGAAPQLASNGDLVLSTAAGESRFHKPVVYQNDGDRKIPVDGSYRIAGGKVGFTLGSYDHSRQLVIDPVLSYVTYLGGSANNQLNSIAVDASGSVYVAGTTTSLDFPVTNAYKATNPNVIGYSGLAIFVSKFNSTGTALAYSTYLGSSQDTYGNGVAVDAAGSAYVVGYTPYGNYPVTPGAFQTVCGGQSGIPNGGNAYTHVNGCGGAGQGDAAAVLTKLTPAGDGLVYSTYLSGNNGNIGKAVAVNSAGEAYVSGITNAYCPAPPYNSNGSGYQAYSCFPSTANAADPSYGHSSDTMLFLTKFNAQGSGLVYSTVLSNHNPDGHYVAGITFGGLAIDAAGNAYVTGYMDSNYFILTTPGSYQPVRTNTNISVFVAKFNPAGATASDSLAYSTYLGGNGTASDVSSGIVVDGAGNALATGYTTSCTWPVTAGAFFTTPSGSVANNICGSGYLTKFNAAGSGLVWSTYTANQGANGRNNDNNDAIALAADSSVYVVGDEQSVVLSPTVNPLLKQLESHFTYIKHFTADGSKIDFSSPIGGTTDATSIPTGVALDPAGNIYIAGYTNSGTWPTTSGAFQPTRRSPGGNDSDGFVVKLLPSAPLAASTTTLSVSPANAAPGQTVTFTATVTGPAGGSTPTGTVTFLNGTTTLGTGTLDASGVATFTSATLAANTYNVTASYAGDSGFNASVSSAQTLTIATVATTTNLTITPAAALVGQTVTVVAKVTPTSGTAIPTGTITFLNGSNVLATTAVDGTGSATYTSSSPAAGTFSISAVYSGDATFTGSTSAAQNLVVTSSVGTSTTLSASASNVVAGTGITFTAQVTPVSGSAIPTGTVTFNDGANAIGTGTLNGSGSATFATTALAVGTHAISALYGGDALNNGSGSAPLTITVTAPPPPDFSVALSSTSGTAQKPANGKMRLATTNISITPVNGFNAAVTFTCSGLPAYASCTFAPASVTPSGSPVSSTLTITADMPKTSAMAALNPLPGRTGSGIPALPATGTALVLGALCFAGIGNRKARRNLLRCLAVVITLATVTLTVTGCGSSSLKTTPAGTYNVVISATAGAATHNATYTLTVPK